MNKHLKFLVLILICVACTNSSDQNNSLEEKMNIEQDRVIVYQIFTRLFTNTNQTNKLWGTKEENGVGKMEEITPKALVEIKSLGITHVWYTGVIEHALLSDYTEFGIPLDDADVVKGRAGSPYAIKDYYDINPDLAKSVPDRMKEFEALVERTHQSDLKVIIDFVPNHVSREYYSDAKPKGVVDFGEDDDKSVAFDKDNNFYYLPGKAFKVPEGYQSLGPNSFPTKDGEFDENPAKATGNDVFSATPSIHDWFETVKLNYAVEYQQGGRVNHFYEIPDTWNKMKDILLFWASKGVDGFRCDMAEMVPVHFWEWVIKEIKTEYPDLIFVAEIYNPNNYRNYINKGGFDYLYDKVEMYDSLKNIVQDKGSTDGLTAIWQRQDGIGQHMLRFLENHDEQRIASPDFAGDIWPGVPMMAVSSFIHKGPVMLYFGQEVGEPGAGVSGFSGNDGRTTIFDYWGVPEHIKWVNEGAFDGGLLSQEQKDLRAAYAKILKACNEYEALRSGEFYDLHYYNRNQDYTGYSDRVYAFVRHTPSEVLLVVTNLGQKPETASIKIPEAAWITFGLDKDEVNVSGDSKLTISIKSTFDYSSDSDLKVQLQPLSYQILKLQ